MIKILLFMVRGKRKIFIGGFPSRYRAGVIFENLEWDSAWRPNYEKANGAKDGSKISQA